MNLTTFENPQQKEWTCGTKRKVRLTRIRMSASKRFDKDPDIGTEEMWQKSGHRDEYPVIETKECDEDPDNRYFRPCSSYMSAVLGRARVCFKPALLLIRSSALPKPRLKTIIFGSSTENWRVMTSSHQLPSIPRVDGLPLCWPHCQKLLCFDCFDQNSVFLNRSRPIFGIFWPFSANINVLDPSKTCFDSSRLVLSKFWLSNNMSYLNLKVIVHAFWVKSCFAYESQSNE